MIKTSIATVSLSGTLDDKLRAIAQAEFDGVEIFEADFLGFPGQARDVGKMVRDFGLKLFAFQPFRDFEGMPEPFRSRNFSRAEHKFDLMQEMGTDLLLICSNVAPQSLGGIDRSAADLRELGERAAAQGLRIGFEALAWGKHVRDYRDAWEIVRRANHPSVGLVLDSFHTLALRLPADEIRSIPADKIFLVQLADAPKLDLDVLSWSRHFRCFPGQGDLPVSTFVQAVNATGYDGPMSLEIFNDQFRAGWATMVAKDGMRSLILLDEQVAQVDGHPVLAPGIPPRSRCLGIEFIEFALSAEMAVQLRKIFTALGFRHVGQHHTKAVERWTQGAINLVINTEADGFAHSHYITHGPGVCAIGLRVADVSETMDRAEKLKAHSFRQPIGIGELEIPAIRGVGGSLLYFIEPKGALGQVWEKEFAPIPHQVAPTRTGSLRKVDHIAQSMHYDEMLSWTLFYTSIFDLKRMSHLEIPDPRGLVQSQVIESADEAVRFVLNASVANQTQSSRFLTEFFGSGVQHMAFATEDIFAAAQDMKAAGLTFLIIPDNYYDDIEARFDLAAETMASLREYGILYDRDGDAEYFQIYTHEIADRFFFEIVERRSYRGYGAPNAPIRLSAQALEARRNDQFKM